MKLLVFPKDPNPYQELLYRQLQGKVERAYLDVSQQSLLRFVSFYPLLICNLVLYRLRGYKLFHLHWIYPFYVPRWVPLHRQLSYVQIRLFYVLLALLGYKVIWTIHNVVPQMPQTPNDELLMQKLGKLAQAKFIHSRSALALMEQHHVSTQNTYLIPHGNYKGVYPDMITRAEARKKLGLKSSDTVLLFFGNIVPYKGLDALLDVTDRITDPHVRIVLAGRSNSEALHQRINRSVQAGRAQYYGGYIADTDVAAYFRAADAVCLPFAEITTSGSTVLALTFGKPVITPRMGALNDIPEAAGYFYDPADPHGLEDALHRAIANPKQLAQHGSAAERYAQSLDWSVLAPKAYEVYERVLRGDTNDKS
ncbi:MAG TPA: glycosyltransferase [Candidatus Saccharimonadales bacterium]|nr:glycosyltransferase [Candidatus Saccharimonadales bacterium]